MTQDNQNIINYCFIILFLLLFTFVLVLNYEHEKEETKEINTSLDICSIKMGLKEPQNNIVYTIFETKTGDTIQNDK